MEEGQTFGSGGLIGADLVIGWVVGTKTMRIGWRRGKQGMYIELNRKDVPNTPGQWEKMLEIFQVQIDRLGAEST